MNPVSEFLIWDHLFIHTLTVYSRFTVNWTKAKHN